MAKNQLKTKIEVVVENNKIEIIPLESILEKVHSDPYFFLMYECVGYVLICVVDLFQLAPSTLYIKFIMWDDITDEVC